MIVAEVLGGAPRPAPRAGTVDGVLQNCSGDLDCAYDLGRLVAKRFRDLKETRGTDYALEVYLEAVRNIEGTVTPDSLEEQVITESERIDERGDNDEVDDGGEDEQEREDESSENPPEDPAADWIDDQWWEDDENDEMPAEL